MARYALLKPDHAGEDLEQLLFEIAAVVALQQLEHAVDRVGEVAVVGLRYGRQASPADFEQRMHDKGALDALLPVGLGLLPHPNAAFPQDLGQNRLCILLVFLPDREEEVEDHVELAFPLLAGL